MLSGCGLELDSLLLSICCPCLIPPIFFLSCVCRLLRVGAKEYFGLDLSLGATLYLSFWAELSSLVLSCLFSFGDAFWVG